MNPILGLFVSGILALVAATAVAIAIGCAWALVEHVLHERGRRA